jgi:predicted  nucleic acid-binding Zn-ribbon protein
MEQQTDRIAAQQEQPVPYLVAEVQSLRAERDRLNKALLAWEDREAAVCPEDVGFEEVIKALEAERDTLREALGQLVARQQNRAIELRLSAQGQGSTSYGQRVIAKAEGIEETLELFHGVSPQTAEETQG